MGSRLITIGLGMRTVDTFCDEVECGHSAPVSLDHFPDEFPVPDIALRVRCSRCSSKRVRVMLNMAEYYEDMRARGIGLVRARALPVWVRWRRF